MNTKHEMSNTDHADKEIGHAVGALVLAFVIIVLPQPIIAFIATIVLPKLLNSH